MIASIGTGPAEVMPGVILVLTGSDAERTAYSRSRTVLCRQTRMRCRSRAATARPSLWRRTRFWRSARSAMSARRSRLSPKRCRRRRTRPSGSRCSTNRCPQSPAPPRGWRRKTPLVPEEHGANLCVDSEAGDQEATAAAFARAAHVVRLETAINRVTGVPVELRAAVGVYDRARRTA